MSSSGSSGDTCGTHGALHLARRRRAWGDGARGPRAGRLGGARGARLAIRLLDDVEERAQLVDVAQRAPGPPRCETPIGAAHAALDDPLLQRRQVAQPVRLPLFRREHPLGHGRRRALALAGPAGFSGPAGGGRDVSVPSPAAGVVRRSIAGRRETTNVCPHVVHCTEAPAPATASSSSSYSV